jgi:hypothetical protein
MGFQFTIALELLLTDGLRVVSTRQSGLLSEQQPMNTMTFTIESVHGVKQTFVLGSTEKVSGSESMKDQSVEADRKTDAKDETRPTR